MASLGPELLLGIVLGVMFVGGLCLLFLMAIMFKLLDKRLCRKTDGFSQKTDELAKAIEQVNKARSTDSKEMKERLSALEEKVELLAKPHSKEKEVELEKVFVKKK